MSNVYLITGDWAGTFRDSRGPMPEPTARRLKAKIERTHGDKAFAVISKVNPKQPTPS